MRELRTEIDIHAPAERVWQILTDFAAYPAWNPFVRSIEGKADEGERLKVVIEPPESSPSVFRPKIIKFHSPDIHPPYQLRWLGKLPISGLFDGEHYFIIMPTSASTCHLTHGEEFRGLLIPLMWERLLHTKVRRGFGEMNLALKDRAEAGKQ